MPWVSFFCTHMYKTSVGTITITMPAYIWPYSARAFCAFIRFKRPTGSVRAPLGSVSMVWLMMYSFQYAKNSNRITVTMLGLAMGRMMRTMVVK